MYPLLETIKISDGMPCNLFWHQERYNYSFEVYFNHKPGLILHEVIKVPDNYKSGQVKARLLYNKDICKLEFQKYVPAVIRTLKLVENNNIEYSLKYSNRTLIKEMFQQRGKNDDILIVKNGRITDSSISNIVFFDGRKWYTPEYPLLKGTARAKLLEEERIFIKDITLEDLRLFTHFRLINSMLDFDDQNMLEISAIK